jgi:hypothetical protein
MVGGPLLSRPHNESTRERRASSRLSTKCSTRARVAFVCCPSRGRGTDGKVGRGSAFSGSLQGGETAIPAGEECRVRRDVWATPSLTVTEILRIGAISSLPV